jgi:hypothetical protein
MKKVTFEDGRGTGINQIAASWSNRAWNLDGGSGRYSNDFFQGHMAEGSYRASLNEEEDENREIFKQALRGDFSNIAEGHYTSDGRYYSVFSYGGDGNGNGFVNFTGYGTLLFGNGSYDEVGYGFGGALASIDEDEVVSPSPNLNIIGWVNPQIPDWSKLTWKQRTRIIFYAAHNSKNTTVNFTKLFKNFSPNIQNGMVHSVGVYSPINIEVNGVNYQVRYDIGVTVDSYGRPYNRETDLYANCPKEFEDKYGKHVVFNMGNCQTDFMLKVYGTYSNGRTFSDWLNGE